MKRFLSIAIVVILLISTVFVAMPINGGSSQLTTLTPGEFHTETQALDINVVFVGFDPAWVDMSTFMAWQLPSYETVVRSRLDYGITESLGLDFTFDYNVVFAQASFTEDLFTYIYDHSERYGQGPPYNPTPDPPKPLTLRQERYNALPATQKNGTSHEIPAPNYMMEAQDVESWLETEAKARLEIDAVNQYTLFFLNGFDYYDHFAHTYWYIQEPNLDTDAVFGYYGSRVMTGWGGQFGRSFFLDLSAGPDNFLFVNPTTTYSSAVRPIWEYDCYPTGHRTKLSLSTKLAYITRFVGVDLLFTPSPLYPPYHQPPLLPEKILIDQNMFEQSSIYSGATAYDPSLVAAEHEDLQPYLDFSGTFQDRRLADYPVLKKVFENWATAETPQPSWFDPFNPYLFTTSIFGHKSKYYWWAAYYGIDNHLYFKDDLFRFLTTQEGSTADYSVPVFSFAVDDGYMANQAGLAGKADDNWVDGTPEYVYEWNTPYWAAVGYGFTETAIHEVGHHICLSHPHDGYDPEYGEVYYLGQFVWIGDNSYTVMSYNDVTHKFGAFNKDSMWRYMTIAYLNYANKIAGDIMNSPHAGDVASMILDADTKAAASLAAYQSMDYLTAVTTMKAAYDKIVQAAFTLNIQIEPYNWHSAYKTPARTATSFNYDPRVDPMYTGPD